MCTYQIFWKCVQGCYNLVYLSKFAWNYVYKAIAMCTCQMLPQNATNLPWNCNKAIALCTCQVGLKIFKRPCVLCLKRTRLCTHQVLPENVYKANIGLLHIKLYLKMQRKLAKNCNKAITLYTYQILPENVYKAIIVGPTLHYYFALKCVQ